jgi:23S rRNA (uracil1939-C5)-methyltransferase
VQPHHPHCPTTGELMVILQCYHADEAIEPPCSTSACQVLWHHLANHVLNSKGNETFHDLK